MRVEISNLLSLDSTYDVVQQEHIGDGISLENITLNNRKVELYELLQLKNEPHYGQVVLREQLEQSRYTHRFFISLDGISGMSDNRIQHAEQLLMRVIILARIVRPIAIPLHTTNVKCFYGDNDAVTCLADVHVGFYSEAYVRAKRQLPRLTQSDAERIKSYWKASQFIHENRFQHLRIYRALYMFNDACHIRPLNIRHVILHAALESLICTSPRSNRLQVVQRLPQLTRLNNSQAEAIYDLCADIKHTAAPNFLSSPDVSNLTPEDQVRESATEWLEEALCELFGKILADRSFADDLAERTRLRQKYPVTDKKGNLI